ERSRTAPRRAGASRHHDGCAAPTLRNRPRPGRTFWTSQAQTLGEGPTEIPDSPRGLGANRSALGLARPVATRQRWSEREEHAIRLPKFTFLALAHLRDEAALTRAYHRLRADAAVGIDGITKEQYGQELERNISSLHERLRTKRWRHQPIRRIHIPKERSPP